MTFTRILILFLLATMPLSLAKAQSIFENPKNLKVLPEDIPPERLREIMRNFSFAMGERCTYCHVSVQEDDGGRMVFDADDKQTKLIAREMIKMLGGINRDINALGRGDDHQYTQVICATCHRGQANPFMIEQVMSEQIATGGTDAAKAKYNELKERYYGGHTYDFTGFTMAEYANRLILEGNLDAALDMAMFSREIDPKDTYTHQMVGTVYMKQEKYPQAIEAYQASLAVDPDQDFVKGLIENAKKAMEQ